MLKLQDHIIEHIFETDELIDDALLKELVGKVSGPYSDKKKIEDDFVSFGLACAEIGLNIGYNYGVHPHGLIAKERGQDE